MSLRTIPLRKLFRRPVTWYMLLLAVVDVSLTTWHDQWRPGGPILAFFLALLSDFLVYVLLIMVDAMPRRLGKVVGHFGAPLVAARATISFVVVGGGGVHRHYSWSSSFCGGSVGSVGGVMVVVVICCRGRRHCLSSSFVIVCYLPSSSVFVVVAANCRRHWRRRSSPPLPSSSAFVVRCSSFVAAATVQVIAIAIHDNK